MIIKCYWCGNQLAKNKKTKDHLLSKYIRKKYMVKSGTRPACYSCNQDRGKISRAFQTIYNIDKKQLLRTQKRLMDIDIFKFRNKINVCLTGYKRTLCLMEIDEVLKIMKCKHCKRCREEIPKERLEVLPETNLCIKCSEEIGGDFEVKIIEENLGSSIVSKPIVHKKVRYIEEKNV